MTLHTNKALLKNTRVGLLGPRNLTMVIGKLDQLERCHSIGNIAQRATVGSTLKLLDLEADNLLELTLIAHGQTGREPHAASIFSPLGSVLLGAEPGEVVSLQSYARDCRYLVISVSGSSTQSD